MSACAKRPDRNPISSTFKQEEQTACAKRPDRNPISSTFK